MAVSPLIFGLQGFVFPVVAVALDGGSSGSDPDDVASPSEVVRQLLIDLGLGSILITDPWPAYYDSEPSNPDSVLTVYDTTPQGDGRSQNTGESFYHYGITVRIRSLDSREGWAKAQEIRRAFDRNVRNTVVTVASGDYCVDSIDGSAVVRGGKDGASTRRSLFTLNCKLTYIKL